MSEAAPVPAEMYERARNEATTASNMYRHQEQEIADLKAKIARLESRGIEDMKYRIKILESALRDVDMLIQNGQIAHARDAIKRALEAATP